MPNRPQLRSKSAQERVALRQNANISTGAYIRPNEVISV